MYERQKKLNSSRSMDMKLSEFMEVYFENKHNELKDRTMKNKRYMMEQLICYNTIHKGSQEIGVTNIEFQILYFLALHKGMVMSKEQIYEYVWNGEYVFDDSNITSHIRRLRLKIEDNSAKPKYIQMVRGIGYKTAKVGNVER